MEKIAVAFEVERNVISGTDSQLVLKFYIGSMPFLKYDKTTYSLASLWRSATARWSHN